MQEQLADLEALIGLVRNRSSRAYILEAVRAYQGGAFRAAIVSTWVAVVLDFVEKLRELDLLGDKNAKAHLQVFEKAHLQGDFQAALKFEHNTLRVAMNEFEFLTPQEHLDLERLRDDRNRCAHPSISSDGFYQPTPELARYHVRNAVMHLLRHPATQGKTALERLIQEVESELFPISPDDALMVLSYGPLRNPRRSLARSFVVVLAKELLTSPLDHLKLSYFGRQLRLSAALDAMHHLHTAVVDEVFSETVPALIREIGDADLDQAIAFLHTHQSAWDHLDPATVLRMKNHVKQLPGDRLFPRLSQALASKQLLTAAKTRLGETHPFQLGKLLEESILHGFGFQDILSQAVLSLKDVQSWDSANALARPIVRQIKTLTDDQIDQIVEAVRDNPEVSGSFGAPSLLRAIRESFPERWESISSQLREKGLSRLFED